MLFIFSTPVLIRHLWQLKTVIFLHWCLIRAVLLEPLEGRTEKVNKIMFRIKKQKWFKTCNIYKIEIGFTYFKKWQVKYLLHVILWNRVKKCVYFFSGNLYIYSEWKRINHKQFARWQQLSRLKASAFLFEIFFVRC